jgi:hypothetical protein
LEGVEEGRRRHWARKRKKWASARKSSTVYPFCYHAREKAEGSISVRRALRAPEIQYLLSFYFSVQKPITRHLVVAARPAKPARPEVAHEPPKREAYPDEVLTHRFRPYGDPGDLPVEHRMDVEMVEASSSVKEKEKPKRRAGETGSSKKKKPKLGA